MKKITLKDLHELNNKYPQLKNMHLSHTYDFKKQEWKFVGYNCSVCGRTFKREGFIERHEDSCKPQLRLNRTDEDYRDVRTKNGDKWKPFA
jgi:hypothetical protein